VVLPEDGPTRYEPFNLEHTITFPEEFGSFRQTMVMNTEEREIDNLDSRLIFAKWGITATFRAMRTVGREWNTAPGSSGGWIDRTGEKTMQPRDFQLQYAKSIDIPVNGTAIRNLSLGVDSRTTFDLQEYTASNFTFQINTALETRFMTVRLSAQSDNNVIFRYFKDLPGFRDAGIPVADGPQNNLFLDLFNSFRFDNDAYRKASGFKIRTFRVGLERRFGDWNATLDWALSPARKGSGSTTTYELQSTVAFMVQWIPISEFRSSIDYDSMRDQKWQVEGL
jgi:hypothetical protein